MSPDQVRSRGGRSPRARGRARRQAAGLGQFVGREADGRAVGVGGGASRGRASWRRCGGPGRAELQGGVVGAGTRRRRLDDLGDVRARRGGGRCGRRPSGRRGHRAFGQRPRPGGRGGRATDALADVGRGPVVERHGRQTVAALGAGEVGDHRGPGACAPSSWTWGPVAVGAVRIGPVSSRRSLITLSGRKWSFCCAEDLAQAVDVGLVELAVPRGRALGIEQTLASRNRIFEIVTSGNSSWSSESTSPIDRWDVQWVRGSRGDLPSRSGNQLELADLQLVAVLERRSLDPLAVEVRAVERAGVADEVALLRRTISAWRRDTVTSSRKMSLSGWRPAWSRRPSSSAKRDPRRARASPRAGRAGRHVVELDRQVLLRPRPGSGMNVTVVGSSRRSAERSPAGRSRSSTPAGCRDRTCCRRRRAPSPLTPRSAHGNPRHRGAPRAAPGRRAGRRRSTRRRRDPR